MKEKEAEIAIEILSPKGKFKLDVDSDCNMGQFRDRVAKLLQADPADVSLIAGGKFAPAEGTLVDFLSDGGRRVFAVTNRPSSTTLAPQPAPTPSPRPSPSSEQSTTPLVLELMPEHIREEVASGGTRFKDMLESWERRMREDPVATSRHLRSPQTRELLESMRAPPRMQPSSAPAICSIDVDSIIMPPQNQKFLQEVVGRQQDAMAAVGHSGGPQGIMRDIKFYHQMMEDTLRLPLPPQPPFLSTAQRPSTPPAPAQTVEKPSVSPRPAAPAGFLLADSPEMDQLLDRTSSSRAVEAFRQARASLRLLQDEAPELLRALVDSRRPSAEAPGLLSGLSDPNPFARLPLMQQLLRTMGDASSLLGGDSDDDGNENAAGPDSGESPAEQHPRKFEVQLAHLRDMGFSDDAANRRALSAAQGNLNDAIDRLNREGGD